MNPILGGLAIFSKAINDSLPRKIEVVDRSKTQTIKVTIK